MQEVKGKEINEVKKPEMENYKNIKPENGMNVEKAKEFWSEFFDKTVERVSDKLDGKEFGTNYHAERHMIMHTPVEDSVKGYWTGERGNSKFIPNENTEAGMRAKVKLAEYGLNGIRYKNGEADFSRCSEATVVIDHMRSNRDDNFDQADVKCAEKWNLESREGRNDWTARDVYEWRHKNKYSWHERCDTKSMDLVSRDIHNSTFSHSGGVSECKVKEGSNNGGEFDD